MGHFPSYIGTGFPFVVGQGGSCRIIATLSSPPPTPSSLHAGHWSIAASAELLRLPESSVVFHHSGALDHEVLQALLQRAEESSLANADGVVTRKRLLTVIVEALENLRVHAQGEPETVYALLVGSPEGYRLQLGNAVPIATAELLLHRIEVLNDMTEADLKEHFLRLLSHDGRTERGGAGLGLLTLARKGARPLKAVAVNRDSTSRYFLLEVAVLRH